MRGRLLKSRLVLALVPSLVIACSGAVGCGRWAEESESTRPPRAIVLISIDSLRADHLGAYGYPRDTSPAIDRLAADGVLFEDVMSTTTWTLPSHLSMLTSLYPEVHGVVRNGLRLDDRAVLVSELLGPLGYRTAAFVSAPYLSKKFGYDQGFDLYDEGTMSVLKFRETHRGVTTPVLYKGLERWVETQTDDPFFLFVHFWDVHYDYAPPSPFDSRFDPDYTGEIDSSEFASNKAIHSGMDPRDLEHIIALYDGEIAFTDLYIGRFLELLGSLGLYDEALIVLTADHGEEFFEHGGKGHSHNLFQESLAVPLIIKFPNGRWAGRRVDEVVSIVDIAPTLLDLLGQPPHPEFNGRSLLPLLRGERAPEERTLFADLREDLKVARRGRYKLIRRENARKRSGVRLFDLQDDPSERTNLVRREQHRAQELGRRLDGWSEEAKRLADRLGTSEFEYDRDLTEQLRSLGYLE